jgi:NTE family protein
MNDIAADQQSPSVGQPTIGLALGGGSARGLAHIAILEAFDELGIKPAIISGTSFGAIVGACYAAGLSAKDVRDYAAELLSNRRTILYRLLSRIPGHLTSLWTPRHPAVVDGVTLFDMLLPEAARTDFANLAIPLRLIAVDFHRMEQVVLSEGPVLPAIAASAALPSIIRPVEIGGRTLIDGGFANPTPFDVIMGKADITVAVDVTGAPDPGVDAMSLSTADLWTGALHALFTAVTREKLARRAPDLFVRPDVGTYETMDFLKMDEILAVSEPAKQAFKRSLSELLERRATESIQGQVL